jgi:hypothetical protein
MGHERPFGISGCLHRVEHRETGVIGAAGGQRWATVEVMAIPNRFFLTERVLRRSTLCVQVNGFPASIVEEEFNGTGAGVSYLFDQATQCADRL